MRTKQIVLLALGAVLALGTGSSQGLTGAIIGIVKDPGGSVVPDAVVKAKNAATNADVLTKTDQEGYYRFANLPPGNYSVSVEAAGFRKSERPQQLVTVAANVRVDFSLEIGQVSETVTVDGAGVQVNTEDAQMGRSLTDIPALPNISGAAGRNPLNLMALQPGIVSTSGGPSTTVGQFSVNGQRAQANNFLLDGTDSNDLAINIPDSVSQISPNAISEFRVVTGAMKAEYGRNGGAVVEVVTRSGSNKFSFSAQEIFRNTALNASNFFQNVTPGGISSATARNGSPNGIPTTTTLSSADRSGRTRRLSS